MCGLAEGGEDAGDMGSLCLATGMRLLLNQHCRQWQAEPRHDAGGGSCGLKPGCQGLTLTLPLRSVWTSSFMYRASVSSSGEWGQCEC